MMKGSSLPKWEIPFSQTSLICQYVRQNDALVGRVLDIYRTYILRLQNRRESDPPRNWIETPDPTVEGSLGRFKALFEGVSPTLVDWLMVYGEAYMLFRPCQVPEMLLVHRDHVRVSEGGEQTPRWQPSLIDLPSQGYLVHFHRGRNFYGSSFIQPVLRLSSHIEKLAKAASITGEGHRVREMVEHLQGEVLGALNIPRSFVEAPSLTSEEMVMTEYPKMWNSIRYTRHVLTEGFARLCELYFERLGIQGAQFQVIVPR
jgi:hypothetical protein